MAIGNLLSDHDLPRKSEKPLARTLIDFAKEVDRLLENPTAQASALSKKYARAIEKGSNEKARRTDRHETLLEQIESFFKEK